VVYSVGLRRPTTVHNPGPVRDHMRVVILYIGALAAEVIGLALAARGFRRTWQESRSPEDCFLRPVTEPIRTRIRVGYVGLRALIGH
jgi:hypothetical protein